MAHPIEQLEREDIKVFRNAKETGRELGRGSYGTVVELVIKGAGKFAGKKIHEALVIDRDATILVKELKVISSLEHKHIVKFFGVCYLPTSSIPALVMELMDQSLEDAIEDKVNYLEFKTALSVFIDIANGLSYLHRGTPRVFHRDLTARNVLLDKQMGAKITDFGNSKIIDPAKVGAKMTQVPGTCVYMPPEAFGGGTHYNDRLDIFSFGHLALYACILQFPGDLLPSTYTAPDGQLMARSEVERRQTYMSLLSVVLPTPDHYLHQLIEQCLNNDPTKRPSADELLLWLEEIAKFQEGYVEGELSITELENSQSDAVHVLRQMQGYISNRPPEPLEDEFETSQSRSTTMFTKKTSVFEKKSVRMLKEGWKSYQFTLDLTNKIFHYNRPKPYGPGTLLNLCDITEVKELDPEDSAYPFEVHFKGKFSPWVLRTYSETERREWKEGLLSYSTIKRNVTPQRYAKPDIPSHQERYASSDQESKESSSRPVDNELKPPGVSVTAPSPRPRLRRMNTSPLQEELESPDVDSTFLVQSLPVNFSSNEESLAKSMLEDGNAKAHLCEERDDLTKTLPQPSKQHLYMNLGSIHQPSPKPKPRVRRPPSPRPRTERSQRVLPKPRPRKATSPSSLSSPLDSQTQLLQALPQTPDRSSLYENIDLRSSLLSPESSLPPFPSPRERCFAFKEKEETETWPIGDQDVCSDLDDLHKKALSIPLTSLSHIEKISEGQYGAVYRAEMGKNVVSLKTVQRFSSADVMYQFESEMSIMSRVLHNNIAQVHGILREGGFSPALVVEFSPHGNLKTYLCEHHHSISFLVKCMTDVALGMNYLCQRGLIHRDLAARNVLLDKKMTCKISDFGLLREVPKDKSVYISQSGGPSPIRWMAPESISDNTFSPATDAWSYGIVLWEMSFPHDIPYPNMDNMQMVAKVTSGYRMPIPEEYPELAQKIMKACWQRDPGKRPTFELISSLLTRRDQL